MTDEQFELLTPSLLQSRPNTYTLTKAIAENLLQEEASDLPVAIIRPSIIGAAVKEPLPVCNKFCIFVTSFFYQYCTFSVRDGLIASMDQLVYLWQ